MLHKIKLDISFCTPVNNGEKPFEIRKNDRGFQKGDLVQFVPVKNGIETHHPIEVKTFKITYVMNGYGIENGFCVFGIKPYDERRAEFEY